MSEPKWTVVYGGGVRPPDPALMAAVQGALDAYDAEEQRKRDADRFYGACGCNGPTGLCGCQLNIAVAKARRVLAAAPQLDAVAVAAVLAQSVAIRQPWPPGELTRRIVVYGLPT